LLNWRPKALTRWRRNWKWPRAAFAIATSGWSPTSASQCSLGWPRSWSRCAKSSACLIAQEGGKPLGDATVEVDRAIDGVRNAAEELRNFAGREIPMGLTAASTGRWAFTTKEPIGVVVAISAFNHPLNLIVHQVAPAIATGCPVIVKPAPATPLCCLDFVRLVHEAGLAEPWRQTYLPGDNALAERLATDPRVAFVSFIGSARVGWYLHSKLALGTRCALEHGGAAPGHCRPQCRP
jgi:acyl-CoA reductase-like NAD-dependent aldehyde dehydrogenase